MYGSGRGLNRIAANQTENKIENTMEKNIDNEIEAGITRVFLEILIRGSFNDNKVRGESG